MTFRISRRVLAAVVAAAAVTALAACSSSSPSTTSTAEVAAPKDLANSGSFTYGVAATFPPFEYMDNNQATGFDVEMGSDLAKIMGLTPKPLNITFDGLIPALQGKRVDVINSAMYITPERSKQVDFVPYMQVGEALLVPKGNKLGIDSVPNGLSGRTVAVTQGAIGQTYMTNYNKELKAAGKAEMKILALPTNQDALLAVKSGRADAFDTSTPGAAYTLTQEKNTFEVATTFEVGTKIGIAVPKGNSSTKKAVTAALQKFVDSGDYAKLMKKYNLPADSSLFN